MTDFLDPASLPPIFILTVNLSQTELHNAEDRVYELIGKLSYKSSEACIFVGKIDRKKRAALELRNHGIWSEEFAYYDNFFGHAFTSQDVKKRKRLTSTDSDSTLSTRSQRVADEEFTSSNSTPTQLENNNKNVLVVKYDWIIKSAAVGYLLDFKTFIIYSARKIEKPSQTPGTLHRIAQSPLGQITSPVKSSPTRPAEPSINRNPVTIPLSQIIPQPSATALTSRSAAVGARRFGSKQTPRPDRIATVLAQPPRLDHSDTSKYTNSDTPHSISPEAPWQLEPFASYACCRSTYADPPNAAFISHLYSIKLARILTIDEIGVRAYSTAIASLSAYPYIITHPAEIARLPGCSEKMSHLWIEWHDSHEEPTKRTLQVTTQLDQDPDLNILKLFYNIWGVGASTAREFLYERGWRDLDDVVEYGWKDLTRAQQIGVKFYDEFLMKIQRDEVREIADVVLRHARRVRNIPEEHWTSTGQGLDGFGGDWKGQEMDTGSSRGDGKIVWDPRDMICVITGGYRRGKSESNDVDVILSHRNPKMIKDLVIDVLQSLESESWVTHTLTLQSGSSTREKEGTSKTNDRHKHDKSHKTGGFDSLDKAFCVFQNPIFEQGENGSQKNPNKHRRVDIIISPFETIGAAILGWSGATTFERDIRRFVEKEKGWKFDSSGVTDRSSGLKIDLESPKQGVDDADGWEDRERRLMDGLGIGWRPARERFTG